MRVLVYGAGAIGGYLGARLLHAGHEVVMLDRASTADAINENGLIIEEEEQQIHVRPLAVTSLDDAAATGGRFALILMGLKSYDLPAARQHLAAHDTAGASILTVQNGIGIETPFIEQFGADRIIAGSLTTPVSKRSPLHLIVERGDRGLGLAPTQRDSSVSQWTDMFQQAGVDTISVDNYQAMKWSKAFLNIIANASSAILSMPPGEIYEDSRLFDLELAMLRETLAVMDGLGLPVVDLPGSAARTLARAVQYVPRFLLKPALTRIVASGRGDKMPSFYIDLLSGSGKSEVIYHNGAIAAAGAAVQVDAPVNRMLNEVLMKLTRNELEREQFAHNPQRLLAELLPQ